MTGGSSRDRARRSDDGWVLAVFSVPESERQQAAHAAVAAVLARLRHGGVRRVDRARPPRRRDARRARAVRAADVRRSVPCRLPGVRRGATSRWPQWWDLARLQALYDEFLDDVRARAYARGGGAGRKDDEAEAFADYVRALTAWRRLPYLDPGLPPEVLPRDWHGARAADLFFALSAGSRRPPTATSTPSAHLTPTVLTMPRIAG